MDSPRGRKPGPADSSDPAGPPQPSVRPDRVQRAALPDLSALPIAGITRRRVAWILAAIVSVWIVAVFARQVGDAGAASGRADRLRVDNAGLASQVDDLARELDLVQREAFVQQQARAYGLGSRDEHPFVLGPDAPPLEVDAPGSAAVRLGARPARTAPIDAWLDLLFGPSR